MATSENTLKFYYEIKNFFKSSKNKKKMTEIILWPIDTASDSKMTLKNCVQSQSSQVNLYVYRADLLGIQGVGQYGGLYHTGLAFSAEEKTWVIDICALGSLENAVIPTITPEGEATMDGRVSLFGWCGE